MHQVEIRPEIIARVMQRRKRLHLFDRFDPMRTALVAIDMQNTFVAPGAPAEVPAARGIVANINRLAEALRQRRGHVIWVTHANRRVGNGSDWPGFFENFVADDVRMRTIDSLAPDGEGQRLWHELVVKPGDIHVIKNRYSALVPGASPLERILRGIGVRTLLIAGTKTNVCCESTARDAMMLDFEIVMVSDCLAALSDEEHRATLETVIQQFGDVLSTDETIARLSAR
ncbi:MAG TPA: cysteine hydrolase [Alphaproteobacteria bacterium]